MRRIERLGAECRQSIDLRGARVRRSRLLLCTIQKLRGYDARHEKREQHKPVEWIGNDERVVRRKEQHVEHDERRRCHRETKHAPASRARPEHDEQKDQCDVNLLEHRSHCYHGRGA